MVDTLTVIFGVIAAIGVFFGISERLLTKRKELRDSWHRFRERGREKLNRQGLTNREVGFLVIVCVAIGMAFYYYIPNVMDLQWIVIGSVLVWIIVFGILFGNPHEEEDETMTKGEVEKLIEEKLVEDRKNRNNQREV